MELDIVIVILSAILGWFILQGTIDAKRVFTHNQDDAHWIAAAAMTTLILFTLGLLTLSCALSV